MAAAAAGDERTIRLVCISDTHNQHGHLDPMPDGDILLCAGDISRFGRVEDILRFNEWLGRLPYATKIVVHGNHEQPGLPRPGSRPLRDLLSHAIVLEQSGLEVMGLKVFGTRFCWPRPMFDPNHHWDEIPRGTDILLTHGPPAGYRDGGTGCESLLMAIRRIKPRLVVFGHVHSQHGVQPGCDGEEGIIFVNAAICGGDTYAKAHEAIVIELPAITPTAAPTDATTS
jgi:predicted phosphohydrolase